MVEQFISNTKKRAYVPEACVYHYANTGLCKVSAMKLKEMFLSISGFFL